MTRKGTKNNASPTSPTYLSDEGFLGNSSEGGISQFSSPDRPVGLRRAVTISKSILDSGLVTRPESVKRKLTKLDRLVSIKDTILEDETKKEKKIKIWTWFSWAVTCFIPSRLLVQFNGMDELKTRQAWREKIAWIFIILVLSTLTGIFLIGSNILLCNSATLETTNSFNILTGPLKYGNRCIINGYSYDLSKKTTAGIPFLIAHNAMASKLFTNSTLSSLILGSTGMDISNLFPLSPRQCSGFNIPKPKCAFGGITDPSFCHSTNSLTSQWLTFLNLGPVYFSWDDISSPKSFYVVYGEEVINLSFYVSGKTPFLGDDIHAILMNGLRTDISIPIVSKGLISQMDCLAALYPAGKLQLSIGCVVTQISMYIVMAFVFFVIALKFMFAVVYSRFMAHRLSNPTVFGTRNLDTLCKNDASLVQSGKETKVNTVYRHSVSTGPLLSRTSQEKITTVPKSAKNNNLSLLRPVDKKLYTMISVCCYSEGYSSIKATLDSLANTDYDNDHRLLFVLADGIVTGEGESKSTPDILIDMLDIDKKIDDPPREQQYLSIGMGSLQIGHAQVYMGTYSTKKSSIRTILIVKCGNTTEKKSSKPGNRGKRDSQIILMRFLQKVTLNDPMTPLEYDIFTKIHHLMGVTPDAFETILAVDADTIVYPDSLLLMNTVMESDSRVIGLCGETKIINKNESWVTRIQVFEYFFSYHYSKSFESFFGCVTCLPGCFCMFRIKTSGGDGYWVPVICNPDIVDTYSKSEVDTLHKKNLFSLGEDRFLTTILLRKFTKRNLIFVPQACCKTTVPAEFSVLLSQRRRWINSTIHNLLELMFVKDLCGIFCFSMQFLIAIDLITALTLPANICFAIILIITTITGHATLLPLVLILIIIFFPPILVTTITKKWSYVHWMLIYLVSIPIWNFVLPLYAFWNCNDFSWGTTRMIKNVLAEGYDDDKAKKVRKDEPKMPLMRWEQWEKYRRESIRETLTDRRMSLRSDNKQGDIALEYLQVDE